MPRKKKTTEEWIEDAHKVHGDKYDYSKVEYQNAHRKVCIICPEHGEFWQSPNNHLNGCGCLKCGKLRMAERNKCALSDFEARSRFAHSGKYDYSKVI